MSSAPSRPSLLPSLLPRLGRVAAIAGVVVVGSVLGLAIFLVALRAGLRPYRHPGLSPDVLVSYALVGTLVGTWTWAIVRRRARRPRVVLRRGMAVLGVVVAGADLVVGATSGWTGAALVLAHHVVVTGLAVGVLRRVLPVGEVGLAVREVPWRERFPVVARGVAALGLVLLAGVWVLVNKPVEGPTLLVLSPSHGVTLADLFSLVAVGVAVELVRGPSHPDEPRDRR